MIGSVTFAGLLEPIVVKLAVLRRRRSNPVAGERKNAGRCIGRIYSHWIRKGVVVRHFDRGVVNIIIRTDRRRYESFNLCRAHIIQGCRHAIDCDCHTPESRRKRERCCLCGGLRQPRSKQRDKFVRSNRIGKWSEISRVNHAQRIQIHATSGKLLRQSDL